MRRYSFCLVAHIVCLGFQSLPRGMSAAPCVWQHDMDSTSSMSLMFAPFLTPCRARRLVMAIRMNIIALDARVGQVAGPRSHPEVSLEARLTFSIHCFIMVIIIDAAEGYENEKDLSAAQSTE